MKKVTKRIIAIALIAGMLQGVSSSALTAFAATATPDTAVSEAMEENSQDELLGDTTPAENHEAVSTNNDVVAVQKAPDLVKANASAQQVGATSGDYKYSVSNGKATITEYYGTATKVAIPSQIGGYTVTSIGPWAFNSRTRLTSITIPDSVTSIEYSAFEYCKSLTSITIPDSVTSIGSHAFAYCKSLTSITIPESVTSIDYLLFDCCSSLENIYVDENNRNYCSIDGILYNKNKNSLITYPAGKKDTVFTIPNSVTSIGDWAFEDCTSLTSITIPDSVTSIGSSAFADCTSLTSITIPNSVTSIGKYAFYKCTNLTSITIPNSVTSIGNYAFPNCTSLTSITIPDSVTSIGDLAFRDCTSLTSITIPDSVTSIGNRAFRNSGLKTIYGKAGSYAETYANENGYEFVAIADIKKGTCGENASWSLNTSTGVLTISGTGSISNVGWQDYIDDIKSVVIEDGITSIGNSIFAEHTNLESVSLPDSITSIGASAFYKCSSLKNINIPKKLKTINIKTFGLCSSLSEVDIPNSVKTIKDYAFYKCTGLQQISIPASVTNIGKYVFYGTSLTDVYYAGSSEDWNNIVIGSNNTALSKALTRYEASNEISGGYNSISWMLNTETGLLTIKGKGSISAIGWQDYIDDVKSVVIEDGITSIGTSIFAEHTNLESVTLPDSITSIGASAFFKCSSLKNINIPKNLKTINIKTFAYCSSLTEIAMPDSVTNIKDYAFYNCNGLQKISIPASVTNIGNYAFYVTSLTDVYYVGSSEDWNNIVIGSNNTALSKALTRYEASNEISGGYNSISWMLNTETGLLTIKGKGSISDIGWKDYINDVKSVVIEEGVTSIGTSIFAEHTNLESVTLPDSITSIGASAFFKCSSLKNINIPKNLKTINIKTFAYCSSLTEIAMPDSVTNIKDYAFYNCNGLQKISIPASVTNIGKYVFYGTSLTDVYYAGSSDDWNNIAIGANNGQLSKATINYNS